MCIEIWNKRDLLPCGASVELDGLRKDDGILHFCSALSGEGLPQLLSDLERRLPALSKVPAQAPLNERQAGLLGQAAELLQEYCDGIERREVQLFDIDWACELLRQACGRLGELTGQECNKAMLRDIFARFCLGK